MKRITAVLLAALMLLSFTACGGKNEEKTAGSDENTIKTTESEIELCADFTVYTEDGSTVRLHDRIGKKPVVVNLWGVWCGPCVSELPAFQSIYEKYGDEVDFMMVHNDGGYRVKDSDIEALITGNSYTFPVYYDPDYSVSSAYFVSAFPTTLFITAEGELMDQHEGMMDASALEECIKELLEE